ncbi:hypothetical protein RSSM_06537 [Rhodopirellula sallentina SM41]|uniref:Uncharacterized protein n=2 Tax=Rhodopirellula TaxID=265488 RepID=M5U2E3_9BACT|nr:hypothetical protein RSSM_06537 [Rhodopirellula sallentina SM41]
MQRENLFAAAPAEQRRKMTLNVSTVNAEVFLVGVEPSRMRGLSAVLLNNEQPPGVKPGCSYEPQGTPGG